MVTSCLWHQLKIVTPHGDESKTVYFIGQQGRQNIELAGKSITTTFSTQAARLEFITIQESLLAQMEADAPAVARFLRLEDELLEAALNLPDPFAADNIQHIEMVAAPFAIYYFALWSRKDNPVLTIPISLFTGQIAPQLVKHCRAFPLTPTGLNAIIAPNFSADAAFAAAAAAIEQVLANKETGVTGLIWCDIAQLQERHCRQYAAEKASDWHHLQREQFAQQVWGLQPVEYLNYAIIMVPHLVLAFQQAVQECPCGILDPILENIYLSSKQISSDEATY